MKGLTKKQMDAMEKSGPLRKESKVTKRAIIVRHTVNPRVTCPFCHRINDRSRVDYCPHILSVKREADSLKPFHWRFGAK